MTLTQTRKRKLTTDEYRWTPIKTKLTKIFYLLICSYPRASVVNFLTNQMENEEKQTEQSVGEMHKRRETMADGRRYIIYYTFGDEEKGESKSEVKENV